MTVSAPCSPVHQQARPGGIPSRSTTEEPTGAPPVTRTVSGSEMVIQTVDDQSDTESQVDLPDLLPVSAPKLSQKPQLQKSGTFGQLVQNQVKKLKPGFVPPKVWMLVFGAALAICAGCVNVVTFRGLGIFTSHVSGTLSRVAMRTEGYSIGLHGHWDILQAAFIVGSFLFGAFLCGLMIPKNEVHFGGKSLYGLALIGNSMLLIAATAICAKNPLEISDTLRGNAIISACLCSMACGLQNAMCTMHFGAVVRTTHVTGTATDIGSTTGRAVMIVLRRTFAPSETTDDLMQDLRDDIVKIRVLVLMFASFFGGAFLGSFLWRGMGMHALLVPALITGTTGITYSCFREKLKRAYKRWEEKQLQEDLEKVDVVLRRANSLLEEAKCKGSAQADVSKLSNLLKNSLSSIREVEAGVKEVYGTKRTALARAFTV